MRSIIVRQSLIKIFFGFFPIGAVSFAAWAGSSSGAPLLLNYEGHIDTADSLVAVSFRLYSDPAGGTPVWSEAHELALNEGRFSVLLGGIAPLTRETFEGDDRYLEISINGQAMSPRQQIASVVYAIRAAHAQDVAEERITPRSVWLSGEAAVWDSTGSLMTPIIQTDSLVVGTTPVIDGSGQWIGPAMSRDGGLILRNLVSVTASESELFFFNSRWKPFDQFDTFVDIPATGKLEVSFSAQISSNSPFETRITLKQVSPVSQFLGQFGNRSGSSSAGSPGGSALHNQALIDVEAGRYRVFIEHQGSLDDRVTLVSGSLIIKVYE